MRAQANGIELAYEMYGPEGAPALVLHHTLSTNRDMWAGTIAALDDRYRILALDARGHGASDAPPPPYDFDTLADDVLGLMDALGIERAHYMGSSMGGMVGQCLGLKAGDRFQSLTLVSTTSQVAGPGTASWDERIAAVRADGMESQVAMTLERWFTAPFHASGSPVLAQIEAMIRATPADGFLGWGMAIRDFDITARLGAVTTPALVVVGEDDPGTTVDAARAIHENIPGSELIIIPQASHQLPLEQPAAFLEAVTAFLARHDPGA